MMKRMLCILLACFLCVPLAACPAGEPSVTTGSTTAATTTATKPQAPATQPLSLTADAVYSTVGKTVTFTATGGAEGEYSFTLSDEDAVSLKTQDGGKLTVRLAAEGELIVRVARGSENAESSVRVFPRGKSNYEFSDPLIYYHGRVGAPGASSVQFRSVANGFEVCFFGTALKMKMTGSASRYSVFVDGASDPEENIINIGTDGTDGIFTLASFEEAGVHRVKVLKRNQEDLGINNFFSLTVEDGGLLDPTPQYTLKMEIYGDSITCGHGAMRGTAGDSMSLEVDNGLGTYAALAAMELGAEFRVFSKSGLGLYTNPYGSTTWLKDIYGDVSVGSREAYAAEKYIPDIIVINIGTNDIWTGAAGSAGNTPFNAEDFKNAYLQFVRNLAARYEGKDIQFFCCSGMMENGLAPFVADIVATLEAEGFDIHAVTLNRTTSNGHPLITEHRTGANILVGAIDEANAE